MSPPKVDRGTFLVIRTDGSEEVITKPPRLDDIRLAIGAVSLDFVTLTTDATGAADLLMAVDDDGWEFDVIEVAPGHIRHEPTRAKKPINRRATELYLAYWPGTDHQIAADVALLHDRDPSK